MATATPDATPMRRCIGSATFGIEAHEAPPGEFPIQPSGKDGLGRMCRPDWNAYTTALRKASLARKAGTVGTEPAEVAVPEDVKPVKPKARSGGALRRAGRPKDADHPAGSIAEFTPVPAAGKKAPKPESTRVRNARAVVAATETPAGEAYTDAIGGDAVPLAPAVRGSRDGARTIDGGEADEVDAIA